MAELKAAQLGYQNPERLIGGAKTPPNLSGSIPRLANAPSHRNDYGSLLLIRLLFGYAESMFGSIPTSKIFVVTCKRCRRKVPYGVREFPFSVHRRVVLAMWRVETLPAL